MRHRFRVRSPSDSFSRSLVLRRSRFFHVVTCSMSTSSAHAYSRADYQPSIAPAPSCRSADRARRAREHRERRLRESVRMAGRPLRDRRRRVGQPPCDPAPGRRPACVLLRARSRRTAAVRELGSGLRSAHRGTRAVRSKSASSRPSPRAIPLPRQHDAERLRSCVSGAGGTTSANGRLPQTRSARTAACGGR